MSKAIPRVAIPAHGENYFSYGPLYKHWMKNSTLTAAAQFKAYLDLVIALLRYGYV